MEAPPRTVYKDLYFRLIISLLAAHFIVVFGEKQSWAELLLYPNYYISVAGSFIIAFLVVSLVRWLTSRLDRKYDWFQQPIQRAGLQILLVLVVPSIAAFFLAALYFGALGINILDTVYLRFDFPVVVLLLIVLNAYYISFYFYLHSKTITTSQYEHAQKEVFMVTLGSKTIPLPIEEISYFFRDNEANFIRTIGKKDYLITQSLDEIQEKVDGKFFFRATRQMLVSFKACDHFAFLDYGKLELFVKPEFKEPVIISQRRARNFKEWMER